MVEMTLAAPHISNFISSIAAPGLRLIPPVSKVIPLPTRTCGLAAPQVGVQKRILVIDLNFEDPESPPNVFINPEIISSSASVDTYEEGCLSIPGVYLNVVRPSSIKLSYRDEMGRPKKMNAEGLMARCIQHEIDHLNGVLFVDKVTDQDELKKQLKENKFNEKHVRQENN